MATNLPLYHWSRPYVGGHTRWSTNKSIHWFGVIAMSHTVKRANTHAWGKAVRREKHKKTYGRFLFGLRKTITSVARAVSI